MVPNAKLSDTAVVNFAYMSHRRIFWRIGVEYKTSGDQLRQIRDRIEAYIVENENFAKPPEVPTFVRIDRFSESSIDIMLYCFTKTTEWGKWLEIKEQLAFAIMDIFEEANAGFAFPSQSVYLENLSKGEPDIFQSSRVNADDLDKRSEEVQYESEDLLSSKVLESLPVLEPDSGDKI